MHGWVSASSDEDSESESVSETSSSGCADITGNNSTDNNNKITVVCQTGDSLLNQSNVESVYYDTTQNDTETLIINDDNDTNDNKNDRDCDSYDDRDYNSESEGSVEEVNIETTKLLKN